MVRNCWGDWRQSWIQKSVNLKVQNTIISIRVNRIFTCEFLRPIFFNFKLLHSVCTPWLQVSNQIILTNSWWIFCKWKKAWRKNKYKRKNINTANKAWNNNSLFFCRWNRKFTNSAGSERGWLNLQWLYQSNDHNVWETKKCLQQICKQILERRAETRKQHSTR